MCRAATLRLAARAGTPGQKKRKGKKGKKEEPQAPAVGGAGIFDLGNSIKAAMERAEPAPVAGDDPSCKAPAPAPAPAPGADFLDDISQGSYRSGRSARSGRSRGSHGSRGFARMLRPYVMRTRHPGTPRTLARLSCACSLASATRAESATPRQLCCPDRLRAAGAAARTARLWLLPR